MPDERLPHQSGDALSEVLQFIRLRGDAVLIGELGASTAVTFPAGRASFIYMRDGEALISQGDREPLLLQPGDLALLLHANGYTLRDRVNGDVHQCFEGKFSRNVGHDPHTIRWASNQDIAGSFLAGTFYYDDGLLRSLLTGLPSLIHAKCDSNSTMTWQAIISRFLGEETSNVGPGSYLIISRLIDLLVTRTLQNWINSQKDWRGWLSGFADERIRRALNAMHQNLAHTWTVESLAEIAAMSRSVFSDRFTAAVGIPPLRYLTRWRLTVAADLLRSGDLKVREVAHRTGYGSEAAFSRAFKVQFGYPPRDMRQIAQTRTSCARSSETD